ncbi:MAG: hypothetical protein ASARMPREDX12_005186 [Alectoria sarmentosa]|nr:MAG: hypothetical protein ASARMPREDX12_005186 [Alectoria sarmentosa]
MASIAAPECEPEYGRRLIPTLVDEIAASTPNRVYASIPRNQDFTGGFDDVTFRILARAVNRAAFWIENKLGKSAHFETIAYLGPMDLRYYIVALAATKVGYKVSSVLGPHLGCTNAIVRAEQSEQTLLPSPRNSIEGHLALLESTNCTILISPVESKVDHLLSKKDMRHLNVEGLKEFLRGDFTEHYEYNKTFREASQDPFMVVHTSGSTGLPKPITLYHGGVANVDNHHLISALDGFDAQIKVFKGPVRTFTSLPPFHVAGIVQCLLVALYFEETIVWPPPGRPISADLIHDLLDNVNLDVCFLAPSTWEDFSQSQNSLEKLKKLKYARYAGGPLGKTVGDAISKHTDVLNVMGTSEVGLFPNLHKPPEDWVYFHFDPRMKGVEFREVSPGLYEQVFTRHDSTDPLHWSFYTFPDQSEFSMNDVYSKHPSKQDLWLYEGRSDDVIVFSNGEKFNPNDMEATLRSCPGIFGALVVGQGRFEAAALLELKETVPETAEGRKKVLDDLSPYVTNANESAPGHAKLDLDHIIFTKAGKPMLRTDKSTVKRRATNQAYEEEIDQLYRDLTGLGDSSDAVQLNPRDQDALRIGMRNILTGMGGLQNITFEQDFFAAGMDSLQVMNLVRQLRSSFRDHDGGAVAHLMSPRTIYSSPTISKLANAVHNLADHGGAASESMDKERIGKMEAMLAKYSHGLPQAKKDTTHCQAQGLTVVLTGSTGSLGSYLLDCLLANTLVTKVICLNRGADTETKQKNGNRLRGLITEWGDRVQFLTTDLSKDNLGLGADNYKMLAKEASFIIHNQWQVDFNLNLESFEPHIAGVRDLINLSNQSPKSLPILFTSSVSTLDNWAIRYSEDKVPESVFYDFSVPAAMGYGESKYVAEQLLEKAGKDSSVSAAICRVGQLAGPVIKGGVWNKQEWLPSLIASSKYLGKIPTTLPGQDTVAWIPVDITANVIVDLLLSDIEDGLSNTVWTNYHNVVNPQSGSWEDLVPSITKYFDDTIEPVSFKSWFETLKATASKTDDVAKNPGIKLLEFFEQMEASGKEAELETEQTVKRSQAMRELRAVGPEWMEIWLRQWGF